jgi:fatty acid desaturase
MRKPGLLYRTDFQLLTDGELVAVKNESASPGSLYWDWATDEQKLRSQKHNCRLVVIGIVVAAIVGLIGAIASGWTPLIWWVTHGFRFR